MSKSQIPDSAVGRRAVVTSSDTSSRSISDVDERDIELLKALAESDNSASGWAKEFLQVIE